MWEESSQVDKRLLEKMDVLVYGEKELLGGENRS